MGRGMSEESVFRGNTLRIYIYMLRKGKPVGVREISRALGLRNPSLVHYHLNKLMSAGYVKQQEGKYVINKAVRIGIIRHAIIFQGIILPRFAIYLGVFLAFLLFEIFLLLSSNYYFLAIFSILVTLVGIIIMVIETRSLLKELSPYIRSEE